MTKKNPFETDRKNKNDVEKKSLCVRFLDWIKHLSQARVFVWLAKLPWRGLLKNGKRVLQKGVMPLLCFLVCFGALLSVMAFSISAAVCDVTKDRIVTPEQLAESDQSFDYILVLGCRVYSDGRLSPMLEDRLLTAFSLYEDGVCDRILMSGDSRTVYYDEVGTMREAAIAAGIPADAIFTDPAGLSTYDSVAHLLSHFEGKRVVIVTQEYHLYRSLYLAEKLGVDAYGVSADRRPYSNQWKYSLREVLARCKDVAYALVAPEAAPIPE